MSTNKNENVSPSCSCLELDPAYNESMAEFTNQPEFTNQTKIWCDELKRILEIMGETPDVVCPPYDYGISCKQHDLTINKQCQNGDSRNIPNYCYQSWCYVDKNACFSSDVVLFGDKAAPGEYYYSYGLCDKDNSTDIDTLQEAYLDRNSVKGKTLTVIIPNEVYPFHFKDPNHPDYDEYPSFDNTEYRGIIIEYLELLRLKTPIAGFEYAEKSGGAMGRTIRIEDIKNSTYTAAVIDIHANLGNLAGGAYWVTSERLRYTPFTIPVFFADFYLFELERQGFDILYSIQKTLRPFDHTLWYVLIICIIAFGITNVMSANARGDQGDWHEKFRDMRYRTATRLKRYKIGAQTYLEGIIMGFVEYFGNASEMDQESTISHKVLVFGFGFFILILSSSYTANLASFLSAPKVGDYVDDLDEALQLGKKICFEEMLEESILSKYSMTETQKKNLLKPINFPRETFYANATHLLQKHTCDVFIGDSTQLQFLTQEVEDEFCASGTRSFGVPVLTMEWAFPINPEYSSDFSEAILELQQEGTEMAELVDTYSHGLPCPVFIKRTGVENAQLGLNQLFFPFFVLMICICIGSMCKVDPLRIDEDGSFVDGQSVGDQFEEETGELEKSSNSEDSLTDALEYKYRLDLVQLNVKKLQNELSQFCRDMEDSKIK